MFFASQVNDTVAASGLPKESLRDRENRRRDLSRLMESWQCTVGFEFHVQMNTKYKMFSSKYNMICSLLF